MTPLRLMAIGLVMVCVSLVWCRKRLTRAELTREIALFTGGLVFFVLGYFTGTGYIVAVVCFAMASVGFVPPLLRQWSENLEARRK